MDHHDAKKLSLWGRVKKNWQDAYRKPTGPTLEELIAEQMAKQKAEEKARIEAFEAMPRGMARDGVADWWWGRADNEMIRYGFDWYLVEREGEQCPPFEFPRCDTCEFIIDAGTPDVRCLIRGRPITNKHWMYCANHSELNPDGVEDAVGPMYGVSHAHNQDSCIYATAKLTEPEPGEADGLSYERPG